MDIVVVEVASVVADVTIEYRVHLADVGTGPLAGAVRSSQSSLCVQGMLRLTEWLRWTQQRFAGRELSSPPLKCNQERGLVL